MFELGSSEMDYFYADSCAMRPSAFLLSQKLQMSSAEGPTVYVNTYAI